MRYPVFFVAFGLRGHGLGKSYFPVFSFMAMLVLIRSRHLETSVLSHGSAPREENPSLQQCWRVHFAARFESALR